MSQTIGETRNAMIADDERIIQQILDANKRRKGKYWIVLFAKKAPVNVDGKPTVTKYIKPYFKQRPRSMVGLIIGEVDNSDGSLIWEVNHHDMPIDFEQIGLIDAEPIAMKSKIGASYVYNN
jgi:predicted SnoaL-like aldol condensation-catalyzing enzyme